jgi:hypothetical protein
MINGDPSSTSSQSFKVARRCTRRSMSVLSLRVGRGTSLRRSSEELLSVERTRAKLIFLDVRQAVEQLVEPFGDLVLLDQECFKKEDKWRELLQLIPDAKIVKNLEKKWARLEDRSSDDKWSDFKAEVLASYSRDERVSVIEPMIVDV